jgi:hypothetical protein
VKQHGRPVSVYTDKASLFQIAPRASHHRDALEQQLTQIGRALQELNIEWIADRRHSEERIFTRDNTTRPSMTFAYRNPTAACFYSVFSV